MNDDIGPGSRLGPLAFSGDDIEVGEFLGSGVAGQVYACTRVQTGERLAVKIIDLRTISLMDRPAEHLKKLEIEVRALREAHHVHCLSLYDIIRTRQRVCLVMELLKGGELFDKIIQKKRFSENEARHVFRQVVDGLQFLHSKGIVHRDLKPENILVAEARESDPPNGDTLYDVKIADYGLSKFKDTGSALKSTVGTPQYWAPEVLDNRPYDERVDLWSLGALLYVMLRGQYPFKGNNINEDIRAGRYDLSGGHWSKVSAEGKDLVSKLMQVNPAERLPLEACLRHPWFRGDPAIADEVEDAKQPDPTMVPSSALVKWEGPEAMRIGEGARAFSLRELLQLQLSLARSLKMAWLACRHSHPELSHDIRESMFQSSVLATRALNTMGQYSQVARQVKDRVLPDLNLAVQEAEPDLAVQLLDMVDAWTEGMQRDGKETCKLVSELSERLHTLRGRAQVVHKGNMQQHLEHPPSSVGADSSDAAMGDASGQAGMAIRAQELLKELVDFTTGQGKAPGEEVTTSRRYSQDLVDLLFLAPGVNLGPRLAIEDGCVASVNGVKDAEMIQSPREQRVGGKTGSGKGATVAGGGYDGGIGSVGADGALSSAPASPIYQLLRAQQEIRRVSEILEECNAFWTHMQATVQELSRLKDHTRALLKYASRHGPLRDLFEKRLTEYSDFWGSINSLCHQYCVEAEPALRNMRQLMLKAEAVADVLDAVSTPDQLTTQLQGQRMQGCGGQPLSS